jgi:hypothetical protein
MPDQTIPSFDFASLYPTTMRSNIEYDDVLMNIYRERQRQKLRKERRMKIEKINKWI